MDTSTMHLQEPKKKPKKLRSIRLSRLPSLRSSLARVKSQAGQCTSSVLSGYAAMDMIDAAPNYMKGTSCSDAKESFQKPARTLVRRLNSKPLKSVKRMSSVKFKRSLVIGGTQLTKKLEVSRSNKPGATCSSTLKDSKNPPNKPGGSESEGICPYSYCSLHGHRHGASPPLTRFVSIRQRLLTSQKSIEPEGQITLEPKPCGNMKKGIQTHKMAHNENPAAVQEKSHYSKAFSSITEEDRVDLLAEIDGGQKAETNAMGILGGDNGKDVEIDVCNAYGEDNFIPTDYHPKFTDVSSSGLEEPRHCYNLFLKPDDHLSTSHEEIPTVKKIHQRSNDEETITSPNVEKRNLRLWHLIYRYMATGIAAENKSPSSLDGEDKEEQLEDACTLLGTNDSRFCQVLSGAVQNKSVEDHDGGSQKIQLELYKTDAIKLVQQAFDRILLEIPDKSPDDQSVMPETTLIQEFSEKNHGEGEEMSSSTPDSAMHTIIQASEEMQLKADHINSYKEEKAESMDGNKSNQKFPKGWSNLKKSIILKRFVKALENVRKLNPRKSRNPAMEHDPEAENFHLRHQMTKERKNAEEWMLDYALQQVVSRLAPAQKRKVALLVQAFETVVPPPGIETHVRSSLGVFSQATTAEACFESSAQSVDGTGKERNFGILLRKRSCPETSLKENLDKVGDFDRVEQQILATCGQVKETSLECGCTETASNTTNTVSKEEEIDASNLGNGEGSSNFRHDQRDIGELLCSPKLEEPRLCNMPSKLGNSVTNSKEKIQNIRKIFEEISIQETLISDSEVCNDNPVFKIGRSVSSNVNNASGEQSKEPKSPTAANEGDPKSEYKCLEGLPPLKDSEHSCNPDVAHETQLQKQKHGRLWYLIYKHMVSASEAKDGNQPLTQAADEEDEGDYPNTLLRMNNADSNQEFHASDQNMSIDNQNAGTQNFELCQIEAIKLVEEAIDEIPLPEIQDYSPHDQSTTSDKIPDEKLQEEGEGGDFSSSTTFADSIKNSFGEFNRIKVEHGTKLEPEETIGNNSKPQRSWSNLKKLILLKRFIKALEKVKDFNPRGPRYLRSDPDHDAEKVLLSHRDIEDRKNAEEWMLDYAMQQVVAKLTPARKRRVALLVEAFESVIPTIGS